jgi:hypothetical protein
MAIHREDSSDVPGLGRALLVVLLMIAITAILCVVIYGVMVAIRPIEPRAQKSVSDVQAPYAQSANIPAPANPT